MKKLIIERNRYFDSVFLMRISSELGKLDAISQAVVAMATPINLENLVKSGFEFGADADTIKPADLIIAIDAASDEAINAARARLEKLLEGGGTDDEVGSSAARASSLDGALAIDPKINLALISVPGTHAAREARQALLRGLHVMLFSDNVTVEDEIALKDEAIERGLMMMGPDCGTAIVNGAALGFANVCRSGKIGLVGASGTGIQEISSLVHQLGGGISQAIGTGGRDLAEAVDGRMTRFGIEALGRNPETDVIVVVSKTPSPAVADKVIQTLASTGKPAVVHFIGGQATRLSDTMETTATLADAAQAAVAKAGIEIAEVNRPTNSPGSIPVSANQSAAGRIVGLYCGGTLCQETWSILHQAGINVRSNVAGDKTKKIHPEADETGHVVWDLGDDAFTVGKPHPMIEPSLRDERVAQAGKDPSISIVLADCVIGHGAHENPAGSLAAAALLAFANAKKDCHRLTILASVTGTEQDPQNLHRQQSILAGAGIIVAPSNAAAARAAVDLMKGDNS